MCHGWRCASERSLMTREKPSNQRGEKQGRKLGHREDPFEGSSGKNGKELDAGKPVM